MAPNVKKPRTVRSPWPPTDDLLKVQPVLGWDNWWSLQTQNKRCDVWDIIYYNFATYNPEEVNWYLHEWIGCHDVSNDGKNYCFGALPGGLPMQIFIPTEDWLPPGPQQANAKKAALEILRDPVALGLVFKIGTMELKAGDLAAVATAITSGRITVIHRPCLGRMGVYWGEPRKHWWTRPRKRLLVPFAKSPPVGVRALMVHEAVHAAMDIARTPQTMQQAEALAYIAQALYLRRKGENLGATEVVPSFAEDPRNYVAWKGIFKLAARIAEDIDLGHDVTNLELAGLMASISIAPTYQHEGAPANAGI
jgi:hypothetical protein